MAAPKGHTWNVGNRHAAKSREWEMAIKRALCRLDGKTFDKGLDRLADKIVRAALDGDSWAMLEIANRLDGKPAQALQIDGTVNLNHAATLTDDELAAIAAGGSLGTADETTGTDDPPELH